MASYDDNNDESESANCLQWSHHAKVQLSLSHNVKPIRIARHQEVVVDGVQQGGVAPVRRLDVGDGHRVGRLDHNGRPKSSSPHDLFVL